MEKPEFSCAILPKLNLTAIEKVVKEAHRHKDDPGRLPRKPEKARSITTLAR